MPPGVVTLTATVPSPGGLTALILVSESTVKLRAAAFPKDTLVAPVIPLPLITTLAPRAGPPGAGTRPATTGTGTYVNRLAPSVAEMPSGVVTVTFTVPLPGGLTALICVSASTLNLVAAVFPKDTPVVRAKPLPLITTLVPPTCGPLLGVMRVTATTRKAADGGAETLEKVGEGDRSGGRVGDPAGVGVGTPELGADEGEGTTLCGGWGRAGATTPPPPAIVAAAAAAIAADLASGQPRCRTSLRLWAVTRRALEKRGRSDFASSSNCMAWSLNPRHS